MKVNFTWKDDRYDFEYTEIAVVIKTDPFCDYVESGASQESIDIRFKGGGRVTIAGKGIIDKWDHEVNRQVITASSRKNMAKGA